jgi:D-alanyl-lipoteichoic acid acyltransferase DltB (MBOAT superfamily)
MLFNSPEFIFMFLPVTLLGYFMIGKLAGSTRVALTWLLVASLFFYGWWNPANLWIILASICFNYVVAKYFIDPSRRRWTRKLALALGVAGNLGLLGYFKYANFLADNVRLVTSLSIDLPTIVLPIGISFFTFQQVGFLVEVYRGNFKKYDIVEYPLFVTFFPQLIAGPIVHYRELVPQFSQRRLTRFELSHLAVGTTIFIIGLFKKVVVADGMAPYANSVFGAARAGIAPTFFEAWIGVLAYTFQLYFDFSAYSDMAVGMARMMNMRFPVNFESPYKAVNIVDFWRRWHITLSRFLREYLYIPLGGNRRGLVRRYANLLLTMLLGGLWHGAGWTFVIWGGLHGSYLVVNHLWQAARIKLGKPFDQPIRGGREMARAFTFLCVAIAWVFFRAETLSAASTILSSMFLGNGVSLPRGLQVHMSMVVPALPSGFLRFDGMFRNGLIDSVQSIGWLAVLLFVVWYMPNTHQLLGRYHPVIERLGACTSWIRWRPNYTWSVIIALFGALALVKLWIGGNAEFLYFQF